MSVSKPGRDGESGPELKLPRDEKDEIEPGRRYGDTEFSTDDENDGDSGWLFGLDRHRHKEEDLSLAPDDDGDPDCLSDLGRHCHEGASSSSPTSDDPDEEAYEGLYQDEPPADLGLGFMVVVSLVRTAPSPSTVSSLRSSTG